MFSLSYSKFHATVVADRTDQDGIEDADLRRIPTMFDGEIQLPSGPGEDPPSQPIFDGMEPDIPVLKEKQSSTSAPLEALENKNDRDIENE